MLLKIREKTQGVFSWLILLMICVPFALWGIQNYLDVGQEKPVATVGEQDFFQRDVNRAYAQFSQNLQGRNIDEQILRKQALEKLIRDEVMLQYVQDQGLVVNDETTRKYIATLDYFKTDGKFDNRQYKALLASQRMTSNEFAGRIRKALIMEQFQRSIVDSGFATDYDVNSFFQVQNQQRNVEMLTIPVVKVTDKPSEEAITNYYQQNQDNYKTADQVAIEYIEISMDKLAADIVADEAELMAFYEEQKEEFVTKERRKISHILFADSDTALAKASKARERLNTEDFATLAKELSADKLSAGKGGDLGLIAAGDMQKEFEEVAFALQIGEISQPVKTEFGYHLIKVTELTEGSVKPYIEVKDKVKQAYQKAQAENAFFELGETLAEVSYENSDSLDAAVEATGIAPDKTGLFTRVGGMGIAGEKAVIEAAFSEDVLAGNNSEPIELGADRVLVLRMLKHQVAELKKLEDVKQFIEEVLMLESAKTQTLAQAEQIKKDAQSGTALKVLAEQKGFEYKSLSNLVRNNRDIDWQVGRAIFAAAKPKGDQPTTVQVGLATGAQVVINVISVTEGAQPENKDNKRQLAKTNIARAAGQSDFNSTLSALQAAATITVNEAE